MKESQKDAGKNGWQICACLTGFSLQASNKNISKKSCGAGEEEGKEVDVLGRSQIQPAALKVVNTCGTDITTLIYSR